MGKTNAWWAEHLQSLRGEAAVHVVANDPAELTAISEACEHLRFKLFRANGDQVDSKISLLDTLSSVMAFPDYFGRNWDALEECINDLSWWPSQGFIFLFASADNLLNSSPGDFDTLVKITADASDSWAEKGIPFHVVFTGTPIVAKAAASALQGAVCDHRLL